jgi:hypothetical protein
MANTVLLCFTQFKDPVRWRNLSSMLTDGGELVYGRQAAEAVWTTGDNLTEYKKQWRSKSADALIEMSP